MFLKKYISRDIKKKIKKVLYFGTKFKCNLCQSNLRFFSESGYDADILIKLEVVGGGKYRYDICPVCRSSYRERLVKVYLDSIDFFNTKKRILHFAPEINIGLKLQNKFKENYIPCDINLTRYTEIKNINKIDILMIPFENESFDNVICNHVLEHIDNDSKAMSEIFRILKPEGWAILQVPVSYKIETTIENPEITLPEERLKHFGQTDHVRIYQTDDYIRRLKSTGFIVKTNSASEIEYRKIKKLALHPKEKIFIAFKEKN